MGTQLPSPKKGQSLPQFSAHLYCGQTAGCIKMPLGMEVSLSPGNFVFDGNPSRSPKRGRSPSPIFGPCLLRRNGCMDQDVTWYGAMPRPRRLCVRWGPRSPSSKGAAPPQFSAHVYCDQTAGWMKLVLGTEVGLSPGDSAFDEDPPPSPKGGGADPPIFRPMFIVTKRLDG